MSSKNYQTVTLNRVVTTVNAIGDQQTVSTPLFETLAEIVDIPEDLVYLDAYRQYKNVLKFRLRYTPSTYGATRDTQSFSFTYQGDLFRIVNSLIEQNRQWINFTVYNDTTSENV